MWSTPSCCIAAISARSKWERGESQKLSATAMCQKLWETMMMKLVELHHIENKSTATIVSTSKRWMMVLMLTMSGQESFPLYLFITVNLFWWINTVWFWRTVSSISPPIIYPQQSISSTACAASQDESQSPDWVRFGKKTGKLIVDQTFPLIYESWFHV